MSVAPRQQHAPAQQAGTPFTWCATPAELRRTRTSAASRLAIGRIDLWLLLFATFALLATGLSAISLAGGVDPETFDSLVKKQMLFAAVGVVAAGVMVVPTPKFWGEVSGFLLLGCLCLLVFLLLPFVPSSIVRPINGARAWINIGPFNLQPAEFTKIAYVLTLAHYLRHRKTHRRFLGLAMPAVITFVPIVLINRQPDLGSAMLFVPALFAMLIAAGAKLKHFLIIAVVGVSLAPAAWPFLQNYQRERVIALVKQFQGDHSAADSTQYQSLKAVTLIGAGRVTGQPEWQARAVVGYNDLPEAHNDMVFAVIVNRYGFVGAMGVIALYMVWIGAATAIAARCRDPFGRLVAVGLIALFATQAIVNLGVCTALLPIIGITLPLLSYGGSSILATFIAVGLLVNIAIRPHHALARESFEFTDDDA